MDDYFWAEFLISLLASRLALDTGGVLQYASQNHFALRRYESNESTGQRLNLSKIDLVNNRKTSKNILNDKKPVSNFTGLMSFFIKFSF